VQWGEISSELSGFMRDFSENIRRMEFRYPELLPDIREGNTIFIGSDYGGQHNLAKHETYTFILADLDNCLVWENLRQDWRKTFLRDGRRISYTRLNDRRCMRALPSFLQATDSIPGLIAAILVDKRIKTLFEPIKSDTIHKSLKKICSHWKSPVFERLLRIMHFVSLFLSGLSKPYQNVIWISDEDEIVPNDRRLTEAVKLFGIVSSPYLNYTLGHFRWGTTKLDSKERQLEDLVAVADLVSGSLSSILTKYKEQNMMPWGDLFIPPPKRLLRKDKVIMDWFSDNVRVLKRLVYVIEPSQEQERFNLKHVRFHGTNDVFLDNSLPIFKRGLFEEKIII
jgi:hypothetical protein